MSKADLARTVSVLQVTIRVVGADGAGKTNFIKNASQVNTGPVLSDAVTYVVDRCLCKVKFVESVLQPPGLSKASMRTTTTHSGLQQDFDAEGTVLLYDVMDVDSLRGVPELLSMFPDALTTTGYCRWMYSVEKLHLTVFARYSLVSMSLPLQAIGD